MTFGYGPTTNRRRLRLKLRQFREQENLSLEQVRTAMEWSISKLIRIENGSVGISASDLKTLLQLYRVDDADTVKEMLDLARHSRQRHWAAAYRDHFTQAYMDFVGYEDDASQVTQYHPQVVPGLLQTEEYAREIVTATTVGDVNPAVIEARVKMRIARQQRFFSDNHPRSARFIVAECALVDTPMAAGTIENQWRRLIELSDDPRVEIYFLESGASTMRRFLGPFSLHEFHSDLDPDVVYLDNAPDDDVALIEDERVAAYKTVLEELLRTSQHKNIWRERFQVEGGRVHRRLPAQPNASYAVEPF